MHLKISMLFDRKIIISISLLFTFIVSQAQYQYEWNDYYDNTSMERVSSLTVTADGGTMILGSADKDKDRIWLVKINAKGQKVWSKILSPFMWMNPAKIISTHDDNIVIAASVSERDTVRHKIWLAKIDYSGRILWERLYNGIGDAFCSDVIETNDHGFVIVGATAQTPDDSTDWYVLKVDSLGIKKWDYYYGGRYNDRATAVVQYYDSTIFVAGFITYAHGSYQKGAVNQFSNDGVNINFWDFKQTRWSTVNDIVVTRDSNLAVLINLRTTSEVLDMDMAVIKMTPNGDVLWKTDLDTVFRNIAVSMIETYDEGFAIAYTCKRDGVFNADAAMVKLNPDGKIVWQDVFRHKSDDYVAQIIEGVDNSVLIGISTHGIDVGWNYGVLKYRSIEQSDLIFFSPKDKILTYYSGFLPVYGYIRGYKKPKNLKIYINRKLWKDVNHFSIMPYEEHKFLVNYDIPLHYGKNVIDFVVTDYKNYKFVKSKTVYYLPSPARHW